MSIILIRHGESLGNADHHFYRHHDSANILTRKGVEQCLALSKEIQNIIDLNYYGVSTTIISSRYHRARITAEIVMSEMKKPVDFIDARINERITDDEGQPVEPEHEIRDRVKSLILQHPFDLILFTHGMLMEVVDPVKGRPDNCEYRKYERDELLEMLDFHYFR